MSLRHLMATWAHADPVRSTYRLLKLAIADEANDAGEATPSHDRLMAKTATGDRRTIQRQIRWLEQHGHVETVPGGGPDGVNRYRLHYPGRMVDDPFLARLGNPDRAPNPAMLAGEGGGWRAAPLEGDDTPAPPAALHPPGGDGAPAPGAALHPPMPTTATTTSQRGSSSSARARVGRSTDRNGDGRGRDAAPSGELVGLLESRGLDPSIAAELCARYPDRVRPMVERFDAGLDEGKRLNPGWLVTAITDGYAARRAQPSPDARRHTHAQVTAYLAAHGGALAPLQPEPVEGSDPQLFRLVPRSGQPRS